MQRLSESYYSQYVKSYFFSIASSDHYSKQDLLYNQNRQVIGYTFFNIIKNLASFLLHSQTDDSKNVFWIAWVFMTEFRRHLPDLCLKRHKWYFISHSITKLAENYISKIVWNIGEFHIRSSGNFAWFIRYKLYLINFVSSRIQRELH